MRRRLFGLALAALTVACGGGETVAPAQVVANPTSTDIWVAELLDSRRGLRVGTPVNITDRAGYDNQPFFLPDGSGIYYTSMDAAGQADTWRYEFERGRPYRVTRTLEGEFSPTPLPDGGLAVVRLELDQTQRLWRFDADGRNAEVLLADIQPVGYHAWFDERRVALFILGEPHTLAIADLETGEARTVLGSIGRSLHKVPGRDTVSAVHKVSEDEWNIVEVTVAGDVTVIAPMLQPAEDFAWLPDGQLVVGRGSALFVRRPANGAEWQQLADFAEFGVEQITRLAVSPQGDRIAFVAQR